MSDYVFQSVGLIGKHDGIVGGEAIDTLIRFLGAHDIDVTLDDNSAALTQTSDFKVASRADIGRYCDLAIVIGGDGTLLNAARELADSDTPLVGINLGRLGFLADILPSTIEQCLEDILRGKYLLEERFLIDSTISRNDQPVFQSYALNEVVVHKWNVARMIELETYINGRFVHRQRSDGLIVSTPTGTTAYSLSAGGPIIYPTLNAMAIVPICPHTMSNRPIVVSGDSDIEIVVVDSDRDNVRVTCDGQVPLQLNSDDRLKIRKAPKPLRLIHPTGHDHYELLRAKLQWAEPPKGHH